MSCIAQYTLCKRQKDLASDNTIILAESLHYGVLKKKEKKGDSREEEETTNSVLHWGKHFNTLFLCNLFL